MAKTYSSADNKIEALVISVKDREVAVSVSDDNQFHIDYFESIKEYYAISISKDNALTMTFFKDTNLSDFISTKPASKYRKIFIRVPYKFSTNLTITTTNAMIKLSPLAVYESVSLSCNGGSIEFKQLEVKKSLTLIAKNGNINGTVVGSYDMFSIACEIKKGKCNLPLEKIDGEKLLKATCNNGNININFIKA